MQLSDESKDVEKSTASPLEKLKRESLELYDQTFIANSRKTILSDLSTHWDQFKGALKSTPFFFSNIYLSLQDALFMDLARLYERGQRHHPVVSLYSLVSHAKESVQLLTEKLCKDRHPIRQVNNQFTINHKLSRFEERFYQPEVDFQRRIEESFSLCARPVFVSISLVDLFELYSKVLKSTSRIQENLREQRNHIYAHNHPDMIINGTDYFQKNPIFLQNINDLIDISYDITIPLIAYLTKINKPREAVNSDDTLIALQTLQTGYATYSKTTKG